MCTEVVVSMWSFGSVKVSKHVCGAESCVVVVVAVLVVFAFRICRRRQPFVDQECCVLTMLWWYEPTHVTLQLLVWGSSVAVACA